MVWEEVTDNEEGPDLKCINPTNRQLTSGSSDSNQVESQEAKKEEKKPAVATSGAKGGAKKMEAKPSGGTQKSMMSFFTKK